MIDLQTVFNKIAHIPTIFLVNLKVIITYKKIRRRFVWESQLIIQYKLLNLSSIFFNVSLSPSTGITHNFCTNMAKKFSATAILLIAERSEEIETVITVDVLRRAEVRYLI